MCVCVCGVGGMTTAMHDWSHTFHTDIEDSITLNYCVPIVQITVEPLSEDTLDIRTLVTPPKQFIK